MRAKRPNMNNKSIPQSIRGEFDKEFPADKAGASKKRFSNMGSTSGYVFFTTVPKITIPKLNNFDDMITVIVTNYNKKGMLVDCVKSALNQSYKNIEVIVIDDNSRDNIEEILKPLKDDRIKIFLNKKNYGPYACRNYALDIARGRYVTFLDADDSIKKNHLLILRSCFRAKKRLVGVVSLYNRYSSSGQKIKGPNLCEASILFDRNNLEEMHEKIMFNINNVDQARERVGCLNKFVMKNHSHDKRARDLMEIIKGGL